VRSKREEEFKKIERRGYRSVVYMYRARIRWTKIYKVTSKKFWYHVMNNVRWRNEKEVNRLVRTKEIKMGDAKTLWEGENKRGRECGSWKELMNKTIYNWYIYIDEGPSKRQGEENFYRESNSLIFFSPSTLKKYIFVSRLSSHTPMPVIHPSALLAIFAAIFRPPASPALCELPGVFLPLATLKVRTLAYATFWIILPAEVPHNDAGPVLHIGSMMPNGKLLDKGEDVEIIRNQVLFDRLNGTLGRTGSALHLVQQVDLGIDRQVRDEMRFWKYVLRLVYLET